MADLLMTALSIATCTYVTLEVELATIKSTPAMSHQPSPKTRMKTFQVLKVAQYV